MLRALASSLVLGALLTATADAHASGGWMAQAAFQPTEQRVALAVTPQRTTLWTSLRFLSDPGPVAIVLPVPVGAALDVSSDAWFEALEVATAPRIFPPAGEDGVCASPTPVPSRPFDIAGVVDHHGSAPVQESALLPDLAAVSTWASARGLPLSPALQVQLEGLTAFQLFVVRFDAPPGGGTTATVRVAVPGAWPTLPLSLTAARGQGMLVSTWLIGNGVGLLLGGVPTAVAGTQIIWDAATQETNYEAERLAALGDPLTTLLEAATHDGISSSTPIGAGSAQIDAFIPTYFDRAVAYGPAPLDTTSCITFATQDFLSTTPVAPSCPRAALGTVGPATPCVEAPPVGTVAPATLRCGDDADDLAVALEGATPDSVWITRHSLAIWDGDHGQDWPVSFATPEPLLPVRTAGSADTSGCPDTSSDGAGGSVSSGVGGSAAGSPPDGDGAGSGGDVDVDVPDVGDAGGCDSSSSSGDSCSGDSGGDSCSGGDVGGGDCAGGGGGGGDFTCAFTGHHVPRLAPMLMALLALVAPVRRRGTKARRAKRAA
jgi:hypothetical protein